MGKYGLFNFITSNHIIGRYGLNIF
jgi:hypothetical protein